MVKHWRGLGAVALCLLGVFGAGLAASGRWRRAAVWFGATVVAAVAMVWTVWAAWLVLATVLGSIVDSYLAAARAERCDWLSPACAVLLVTTLAFVFGFRRYVAERYRVPSASMFPTLASGDLLIIDKLTPRWRAIARGDIVGFRYPCDRDVDHIKRVVAIAGDSVEVRCGVVYINRGALARALVEDDGTCRYDRDGELRSQPCRRYAETLGGRDHDVLQLPASVHDFPDLTRGNLLPGCRANDARGKLVETGPETADGCAPRRAFVVPDGEVFVMGDNRDDSNDSRHHGSVPLDDVIGRVVGVWYPLSRAGGVY
jgi:signal peptidase I